MSIQTIFSDKKPGLLKLVDLLNNHPVRETIQLRPTTGRINFVELKPDKRRAAFFLNKPELCLDIYDRKGLLFIIGPSENFEDGVDLDIKPGSWKYYSGDAPYSSNERCRGISAQLINLPNWEVRIYSVIPKESSDSA